MKRKKMLLLLFIAALGLSAVNVTRAQSVAVNFNLFQRELAPHGRWVTNPRFGEVWIYNDPGFKPYYSDGHWEYTDYGWSWVSDFNWGWAPFHYGRWEHDPGFGWMWIPGYDWASAWVSWSSYEDYYGWAPLGYGVNVNGSFGSIPYDRWTFIPRRNICDRDINRYYVAPDRDRGFRNAVVINNYYEGNGGRGRFMRGPERNEVERYTHNRIQERRVDETERQGNRVSNNGNHNNNSNWNGNNNGVRRNSGQQVTVNNKTDRKNNEPQVTPGNNDNSRNGNNGGRTRNNDPVITENANRLPANTAVNDNRRNRNQQNNAPQQQPRMERPARRQPQQPAMEQQRSERRDRGNNGGGQGQERSNNPAPNKGQGSNDNRVGGHNRRG